MRKFRVLAICAALAGPIAIGAIATPAGASTNSSNPSDGTVKGVITNAATGKPLAGVCVNVVDASDNTTVGTSAASSSTGDWSLKNVPPSTTYTAVSVDCTPGTNWIGQWYDGQDFQNTATEFTVTAGGKTKGINFSVTEGGEISGTVTDSTTSDPIQGVLVVALWTTQDSASTYAVCTNAKGKYKLTAVPSTAYVWYDTGTMACGVSTAYNSEYYLNAPTYESATTVTVAAGKTTKNIDQALDPSSDS